VYDDRREIVQRVPIVFHSNIVSYLRNEFFCGCVASVACFSHVRRQLCLLFVCGLMRVL
jgi:hypothetical protein